MTITAVPETTVEDKKRMQEAVAAHRRDGYKCVQCRGGLKTDKTLCGRCRGVFYCSKQCQVDHWHSNHRIACQLYLHILSKSTTNDLPFTFPLRVKPSKYDEWLQARGVLDKGMWRRESSNAARFAYGELPPVPAEEQWVLPVEQLPAPLCKPLADGQKEIPAEVLTNWSEYYAHRQLPNESLISVLMSFPLTIYYIYTQFLSKKTQARKELRIHLLGVERELDLLPLLAELAHLVPDVTFFITLIGPNVHADMRAKNPHSRVRLSFRRGYYHELCELKSKKNQLHPADVVVAQNAALETYAQWTATVRMLVQQRVPAFFTDKSETSTLNATRLFATVGAREAFPVRLNPFRSPIWHEADVHAMPCYVNGFVQAINL